MAHSRVVTMCRLQERSTTLECVENGGRWRTDLHTKCPMVTDGQRTRVRVQERYLLQVPRKTLQHYRQNHRHRLANSVQRGTGLVVPGLVSTSISRRCPNVFFRLQCRFEHSLLEFLVEIEIPQRNINVKIIFKKYLTFTSCFSLTAKWRSVKAKF